MAFDYTRPRATAERLLERFGQSASLITQGVATGSPTNPTLGADAEQAVTVVETEFTYQERQGTMIQESDRKFTMSTAGVTTAPTTQDKLSVAGVTLSIVVVKPLAPGGVALPWEVHCRG